MDTIPADFCSRILELDKNTRFGGIQTGMVGYFCRYRINGTTEPSASLFSLGS